MVVFLILHWEIAGNSIKQIGFSDVIYLIMVVEYHEHFEELIADFHN